MYRWVVTFCQPFTLLVVGLLVGTTCLWRPPLPARRRALIGVSLLVALLAILSFPPVGHLAIASLEWSYPPRDDVPEGVDAIVVLSGSIRVLDRNGEHAELNPDSLYRCLHASKLYQQRGGCRLVVSGGKVKADVPGPTLARAMRDFLAHVGVKPGDILMEEASTTTYENAVRCRTLIEPLGVRRIVLVTSASHMRRAAACFRKQGFDVIPAACNQQAAIFLWDADTLLPSIDSIGAFQAAAHEWLGLAWYWLKGRV